MNLAFTLSKLLDASHLLKDKFAEKHITRPNGKAIGQQACAEYLCQALFSKPYGEVKDMLEKTSNSSQESSDICPRPEVYIFHYGSDAVLAQLVTTGSNIRSEWVIEKVRDRGTGTELETGLDDMKQRASALAKAKGTQFCEVTLPEILSSEWEYVDILNLATEMGYKTRRTNLLDVLMQDADKKLFINDLHCPYSLNGNWQSEVQEVAEENLNDSDPSENLDPLDHVIWHAETSSYNGYDKFAFYYTPKELMQAEQVIGDPTTWIVTDIHDATQSRIQVIIVPSSNQNPVQNTQSEKKTLSADDIEAIFDRQPVYSSATGQQLTFLPHGDNALLLAKEIDTEEDYTMDIHSLHGELDGDNLTLIDDDSTVELTLKP
tara:strand:+ start:4467 stop:5597 length:1131 start_codon:yes stop_codon:yes gene_type:complete